MPAPWVKNCVAVDVGNVNWQRHFKDPVYSKTTVDGTENVSLAFKTNEVFLDPRMRTEVCMFINDGETYTIHLKAFEVTPVESPVFQAFFPEYNLMILLTGVITNDVLIYMEQGHPFAVSPGMLQLKSIIFVDKRTTIDGPVGAKRSASMMSNMFSTVQ
jgi:hypothetical protein